MIHSGRGDFELPSTRRCEVDALRRREVASRHVEAAYALEVRGIPAPRVSPSVVLQNMPLCSKT